jgi:hypothetical protein
MIEINIENYRINNQNQQKISFKKIIEYIIEDIFESINIDWKQNLFDKDKLLEKNNQFLIKRTDLDFSNIIVFNYSNEEIFLNILEKNRNALSNKKIKKFLNLVPIDCKSSNLDDQIHNNKIDFDQNKKDISNIFFNKNDWQFELSSFNLIILFFFFDFYKDDFFNENEIYKFLFLSYYTLKEKNGFFLGFTFGEDNLYEFKKIIYDFLINNKFIDKDLYNKAFKNIDKFKIFHNFNKSGFKNPLFFNEEFNLSFNDFSDFFSFIEDNNLMSIIFDKKITQIILEKKLEIISLLNTTKDFIKNDKKNILFKMNIFFGES